MPSCRNCRSSSASRPRPARMAASRSTPIAASPCSRARPAQSPSSKLVPMGPAPPAMRCSSTACRSPARPRRCRSSRASSPASPICATTSPSPIRTSSTRRRGLIDAFAETDQTGGAAPARPGLFTTAGATALPPNNLVKGLAGQIIINPSVDPSQGGNVNLLRDDAISDPNNPTSPYIYNTTGSASFTGAHPAAHQWTLGAAELRSCDRAQQEFKLERLLGGFRELARGHPPDGD